MAKTRRKFTPEDKATIVRRHLKGKEQFSAIAEGPSILSTQIHQWVAMLIEQVEKAFEKTVKSAKATTLYRGQSSRTQRATD